MSLVDGGGDGDDDGVGEGDGAVDVDGNEDMVLHTLTINSVTRTLHVDTR